MVLTVLVVAALGVTGVWWFLRGDSGGGKRSATPCTTVSPSATAAPLPTASVAPGALKVNVFNATDRKGLARTVANDLKIRGVTLGQVTNDPLHKAVTAPAEVRYGAAGAAQAAYLALWVPGAILVQDQRPDTTLDLVLGAGYATLATPDQVVQAQQAAITTAKKHKPRSKADAPLCPNHAHTPTHHTA
ncbi:MAG: LytR C-terminal domain-containing protein [Mycobacteriales bacterium]